MGLKAMIDGEIWADSKFDELSAEAKLAVFWLLTTHSRDNAGVVEFNARRFEFETRVGASAMDEVVSKGGRFHRVGDKIWIESWIRRQVGAGKGLQGANNLLKNLRKLVENHCETLRSLILKSYPELASDKAPSKGVTTPKDREGKDREGKVPEGESEGEAPDDQRPSSDQAARWARADWPPARILPTPGDASAIPAVVDAWLDSREREGWLTPKGNPIANYRADLRSFGRVWFQNKRAGQGAAPAAGGDLNHTEDARAQQDEILENHITRIA